MYDEPILLFTNVLCIIAKSCMPITTAKQKKRCKHWFNTECQDDVVVIVWVSVGMFVVYRPLLKIVFFSIGGLKYVCVRGVMDVVFSVCIVTRGSIGVSVSSCRCCMFVFCVHPVAVLSTT